MNGKVVYSSYFKALAAVMLLILFLTLVYLIPWLVKEYGESPPMFLTSPVHEVLSALQGLTSIVFYVLGSIWLLRRLREKTQEDE